MHPTAHVLSAINRRKPQQEFTALFILYKIKKERLKAEQNKDDWRSIYPVL